MAMDNLNISNEDVWKRVDNIGSTRFINMVDGTTRDVPWGTMDYWNIITSNILSFGVVALLLWAGVHYLVK